MANDYVWGVDASADMNQELSPVQDSYEYNPVNDDNYWDDSWDDTWDNDFDAEFFAVPEPSGQTSEYVWGVDPAADWNQELSPVETTDSVPEETNSWFDGVWDSAKEFAGSSLGKQVISGGISGLGSAIMRSMNEDAADKRARDERAYKEEQARLRREHELKLQALKNSGGGGGPGPATTKATISSLDQNIIRAK